MSLRFLYNKLEKFTPEQQQQYIKSIFTMFMIKPLYPIEDNFKTDKIKEAAGKNPLGYLIMHLTTKQLLALLPKYTRDLIGEYRFDDLDQSIIDICHDVTRAIVQKDTSVLIDIKSDMGEDYLADIFDIFEFGRRKYSDWSFLKNNPYKLVPAIFRHLYKSYYIQQIDEESGCPHLAHVVCNTIMLRRLIEHGS